MMRVIAGLFLAAGLMLAQHGQSGQSHPAEETGPEHLTTDGEEVGHGPSHEIWWKWANFAILAGVLGYLVAKNAGPYFTGRTAAIRKGIDDADKARAVAEAKMRDVDARLTNLGAEIEALKTTAAQEQAAEAERLRNQTAADLAKLQAHAEQEIAAAGKAARGELKRYAAELALASAEHKIRQRITPEAQDALVRAFAERLPQKPS
jgi:F-type H+-transporting ATPase subunit b